MLIGIDFNKFKDIPRKAFNFVVTGYIIYPLANQQFGLEYLRIFTLHQVKELTNKEQVSQKFRWVK